MLHALTSNPKIYPNSRTWGGIGFHKNMGSISCENWCMWHFPLQSNLFWPDIGELQLSFFMAYNNMQFAYSEETRQKVKNQKMSKRATEPYTLTNSRTTLSLSKISHFVIANFPSALPHCNSVWSIVNWFYFIFPILASWFAQFLWE